MLYEDRISIATPEGVDVELVLGGLGSRFSSAIVDVLIQGLLATVAAVVCLSMVGGGVGYALLVIAQFLILFVYDVVFEVWAGGRTPGKKANGLRVVVEDGRPITFVRSALRNIMRLVDVYATFGLVGSISIFATKRNQRLGDLVAGTLVVRELPAASAATRMGWDREHQIELPPWDVSAVTGEELAAVRSFLQRRAEITMEARIQISGMLGAKLRPKVVGPNVPSSDEPFLELLARVKAARL
ncbi:MAG: hypothetical protein QOE29_979 [Gaiellaceae bacterium]|nr:hypothetical protein [Gaiellaceae bacterium]